MMLVVAVALSTATYAWFTSNTTVKADAVLLTASTMDGEAILITHNANGADAQQAITLTAQGTEKLYPATPKAATSLTTFAATGEEGDDDYVANDIANIGANFQNLIMGGSGTYTDPSISAPNVSFYKDTFYVFNKGFQSTTLVPTVTIYYDDTDNTSAMAAQSARIAIIERVATAEAALGTAVPYGATGYTVKGIWQYDTSYTDAATTDLTYTKSNVAVSGANGSSTAASGYGVVAGQDSTFTQGNVEFTPAAFTAIGAATSGNHIANEYTVIVWLEGWDADCTNAITAGTFKVDVSFGTAPRA